MVEIFKIMLSNMRESEQKMDKEVLTEELALEYRDKALKMKNTHNQYVGDIRKIARELRVIMKIVLMKI